MTACGSLRHLFESPLPENPSLIESLSTWSQMKTMTPLDVSSFTDVFGELHFNKEEPVLANSSSPPPPPPPLDSSLDPTSNQCTSSLKGDDSLTSLDSFQSVGSGIRKDGFGPKNSNKSLQLCTEGLGFESFDDDVEEQSIHRSEMACVAKRTSNRRYLRNCSQLFRSKRGGGGFPPPISCIGSSGKPWVTFRSYRQDGRLVLREIRIPTRVFLHASREDGRLRLHFVLADRDIKEEMEEENEQGEVLQQQQQQDAESEELGEEETDI